MYFLNVIIIACIIKYTYLGKCDLIICIFVEWNKFDNLLFASI